MVVPQVIMSLIDWLYFCSALAFAGLGEKAKGKEGNRKKTILF
jgi:hypothetical protein